MELSEDDHTDDYFGSMNSITRHFKDEVMQTRKSFGKNWESMSWEERELAKYNALVKPFIECQYDANCKFDVSDSYPVYKVNGGDKIVVDLDRDGWTWRDEHSDPFSFKTRSQENLTLEDIAALPAAKNGRDQRSLEGRLSTNQQRSSLNARKSQLFAPDFGVQSEVNEMEELLKRFGLKTESSETSERNRSTTVQIEVNRSSDLDGNSTSVTRNKDQLKDNGSTRSSLAAKDNGSTRSSLAAKDTGSTRSSLAAKTNGSSLAAKDNGSTSSSLVATINSAMTTEVDNSLKSSRNSIDNSFVAKSHIPELAFETLATPHRQEERNKTTIREQQAAVHVDVTASSMPGHTAEPKSDQNERPVSVVAELELDTWTNLSTDKTPTSSVATKSGFDFLDNW